MTAARAWASTLTGLLVWFVGTRPAVAEWLDSMQLGVTLVERGRVVVSQPFLILAYLSAAVMAGVVVSLLTPRVPRERLDRFYQLIHTPVAPGEVVTEPCTLPSSTPVAQRRMLVRGLGFEIPMPSTVSWLGFLAGWLAIFGLVVGFVLLVRFL